MQPDWRLQEIFQACRETGECEDGYSQKSLPGRNDARRGTRIQDLLLPGSSPNGNEAMQDKAIASGSLFLAIDIFQQAEHPANLRTTQAVKHTLR